MNTDYGDEHTSPTRGALTNEVTITDGLNYRNEPVLCSRIVQIVVALITSPPTIVPKHGNDENAGSRSDCKT